MLVHQLENAQQFSEAGHPAFKKQDKTWMPQFVAAVLHER
jgi:hypothetical protein